MRKFEFRLDSALRWRNTQLKLERAKLQSLFAEQQRLNRDVESAQQQRAAAVFTLQEMSNLEAADLRTLASYLVGADFRITQLREQLVRRNESIARQQAQVRAAELQVRLLDKLKDKKQTEWKLEFGKELENNAAEAWLASHFGPAKGVS